jgi:hypothetical protein
MTVNTPKQPECREMEPYPSKDTALHEEDKSFFKK